MHLYLNFFIWSQNVYLGPTLHVDNRSTWNTIGVYSDDARQSEILSFFCQGLYMLCVVSVIWILKSNFLFVETRESRDLHVLNVLFTSVGLSYFYPNNVWYAITWGNCLVVTGNLCLARVVFLWKESDEMQFVWIIVSLYLYNL